MNTIEKTISESKTNKEAASKILLLAKKVGYSMTEEEASQFVKGYKKSNETILIATDLLLQKEAKYNRKQTISYLLSHMPLDVIDKSIADLQVEIKEWTAKVITSPSYYLSWGEGAFKAAAKMQVYKEIRTWIDQAPEVLDEPNFWAEIEKHITKKVIQRASSSMSNSTSHTSNLMETRITEAWAESLNSLSTINRIGFWFHAKNKIGFILSKQGEDHEQTNHFRTGHQISD